jgi:hypothetical protein
MVKVWKTVSVRLSEDELNALVLHCERTSKKKNEVLKELIFDEIAPLLKPGAISQSQGIPLIGEHYFHYDAEKDCFSWKIDMGTEGTHILCEEMSAHFADSLNKELSNAIKERERIIGKADGKPVIPKKILKYKVRK